MEYRLYIYRGYIKGKIILTIFIRNTNFVVPPMPRPMPIPRHFTMMAPRPCIFPLGGFDFAAAPLTPNWAMIVAQTNPIFRMPTYACPNFAMNLSLFSGFSNPYINSFNMPMFSTFSPLPSPAFSTLASNQLLNTMSTPSSFLGLTVPSSSTSRAYSARRTNTSNYKISTKSDLSEVTKVGYNAEKGEKLVKDALSHATGFNNSCAAKVKESIERVGLGNYETGHAYQCVDILRRNPNFKEVNVNGSDIASLPAGCVVVYGRGVAGYSSDYGHIEITTGSGKAVSDGITNNIRTANSGVHVFVPV